jgi:glutamine phosphoribosylpyrophosphate amidotransferase
MIRATQRNANQFCTACFTGEYPIPYNAAFDKLIMERRAGHAQLIDRDNRLPL